MLIIIKTHTLQKNYKLFHIVTYFFSQQEYDSLHQSMKYYLLNIYECY